MFNMQHIYDIIFGIFLFISEHTWHVIKRNYIYVNTYMTNIINGT